MARSLKWNLAHVYGGDRSHPLKLPPPCDKIQDRSTSVHGVPRRGPENQVATKCGTAGNPNEHLISRKMALETHKEWHNNIHIYVYIYIQILPPLPPGIPEACPMHPQGIPKAPQDPAATSEFHPLHFGGISRQGYRVRWTKRFRRKEGGNKERIDERKVCRKARCSTRSARWVGGLGNMGRIYTNYISNK